MNEREYKRYRSFCFKQAKSIVGLSHPEFEDIVSDAFLTVLRAIKLYNPNNKNGASLNTYVTKAIRNHIFNYISSLNNKKIVEDSKLISRDKIIDEYSIDIVSFNDNKDLQYDEFYIIKIINNYVTTLDEKMQKIYKRIFQEEKTLEEVAEELRVNKETIRVNKYKLIHLIRIQLKKLNIINHY